MSTQLAGFKKLPNVPNKLRILYGRILHLARKLPRDAAYKINTEAIICHRLSVLDEAGNDENKIVQSIGCGSIHLLFRQAEEEYALMQKVLIWKPWEPLKEKPPPEQWTWPPC